MLFYYIVHTVGFLCLLISVIIQDPLHEYKKQKVPFWIEKKLLITKYLLGFSITYLFCGEMLFHFISTKEINFPRIICNIYITIFIYTIITSVPFLISFLSIKINKNVFNGHNYNEKDNIDFSSQLDSIQNKNQKKILPILIKCIVSMVLILLLHLFIEWIHKSVVNMRFIRSQQQQVIRINKKIEEIDKKIEENIYLNTTVEEFRNQLIEEKKYCLSCFED